MEHITNTIQNKIETAIYGYQPSEFMPIFEDGELANRSAFIAYKIKRTGQHLGHVAGSIVSGTSAVLEQMTQN